MQRIRAYFAEKGAMLNTQRIIRILHRKSRRGIKKFRPVMIVRTYPNGAQEKMLLNLYKGKLRLPPYLQKEKKKGQITLIDGSVIQTTQKKKSKGKIHGLNFALTMEDEL
jgi:hypothetical protein